MACYAKRFKCPECGQVEWIDDPAPSEPCPKCGTTMEERE